MSDNNPMSSSKNILVTVEALDKSYTKEDFLSLNEEELRTFSKALNSQELASLIVNSKYLYSDEVEEKINAVSRILCG